MADPITVYPEGVLPDLSGSEREVLARLGRASWWVVPGRDRRRCRLVTTLLHGNEPSGFRAIRTWTASSALPEVDILFFLGSVEAALGPPLFRHRARPGGQDQNRCFLPPFDGPEGRRAEMLLGLIKRARPEAVVDLHNNTGHSPAYGVGTSVTEEALGLTSLFADRFMHSDIRLGTLMEALDGRFASVVIECGRAGDPVADATALAGLDRFVTLEELSLAAAHAPGVEVLSKPLRVHVTDDATLAFDTTPATSATLTIRRDVDRHNFMTMAAGEVVGWVRAGSAWPLRALGASGEDQSRDLFTLIGNELRLRKPIVPVMMTTSAEIARSDCLFYALERRE